MPALTPCSTTPNNVFNDAVHRVFGLQNPKPTDLECTVRVQRGTFSAARSAPKESLADPSSQALAVFESIKEKDVVTYNSSITACTKADSFSCS